MFSIVYRPLDWCYFRAKWKQGKSSYEDGTDISHGKELSGKEETEQQKHIQTIMSCHFVDYLWGIREE